MITPSQQPSAFAQMVYKLRDKSDEGIKLLYINFFATELNNKRENISATASKDDIVKAIQQKRYSK
jgi:hypothetical protein